MTYYQECEKWASPKRNVAADFLDWLSENGYVICESSEGSSWNDYNPTTKSVLQLLYGYLEIDENKIEQERRHMIEELRKNTYGS